MKKVKIVVRIIGWTAFIFGLVSLAAWAVWARYPGFLPDMLQGRNLDNMFTIIVPLTFCGLVIALIVEDDKNWNSICRWVEKRKNIR